MNFKKLLLVSILSLNIGGMIYGSKAISPTKALTSALKKAPIELLNRAQVDQLRNNTQVKDDGLIGMIKYFMTQQPVNNYCLSIVFGELILRNRPGLYTDLHNELQREQILITREDIIDAVKGAIKILMIQSNGYSKRCFQNAYRNVIRLLPQIQVGSRILIPEIHDDQVPTEDDIGFSIREILTDIKVIPVLNSYYGDYGRNNNPPSYQLGTQNFAHLYINNLDGLDLLPSPTTALHLYNNKLTTLPEGALDHLIDLRSINIDNNKLTTLPDGIFNHLINLRSIWLGNNKLTELHDGIFDHLINLRSIWLGNNKLTALPDGFFSRCIHLTTLDLSDNKLLPHQPASLFPESLSVRGIYGVISTSDCLCASLNYLKEHETAYVLTICATVGVGLVACANPRATQRIGQSLMGLFRR